VDERELGIAEGARQGLLELAAAERPQVAEELGQAGPGEARTERVARALGPEAEAGELDARGDAELGEDVAQLRLDRPRR